MAARIIKCIGKFVRPVGRVNGSGRILKSFVFTNPAIELTGSVHENERRLREAGIAVFERSLYGRAKVKAFRAKLLGGDIDADVLLPGKASAEDFLVMGASDDRTFCGSFDAVNEILIAAFGEPDDCSPDGEECRWFTRKGVLICHSVREVSMGYAPERISICLSPAKRLVKTDNYRNYMRARNFFAERLAPFGFGEVHFFFDGKSVWLFASDDVFILQMRGKRGAALATVSEKTVRPVPGGQVLAGVRPLGEAYRTPYVSLEELARKTAEYFAYVTAKVRTKGKKNFSDG